MQAVDDERLAADLGHVPAGDGRDPARERHRGEDSQSSGCGRRSACQDARRYSHQPTQLVASISTPMPTIVAEGEEQRQRRRMPVAELVQSLDLAVELVREDQAREPRHLDLVAVACASRDREGRTAAAARRARCATRLPWRRSWRAGAAACSGRACRRRRSAPGSAAPPASARRAARAAPSAGATPRSSCHARQAGEQERAGQPRGEHHVREAIRERRVEDHRRSSS